MNILLISAILSLAALAFPPTAASAVAVSVSVRIAPPLLPVYVQPAPPADDFLWMPGYWAWSDEIEDYFWVPGTWVMAPRRGYLWTPGYWYWSSGYYHWHHGYWGPFVGFYGGVYYGYGYYGSGYYGGRWQGDHFYYNRTVNNVNVTHVHNTYNETVTNITTINPVSYNGGQGGIAAQPSEQDRKAERAALPQRTREQVRHEKAARANRALRLSENKGKPPIAATPRPGAFDHPEARPANGAPAQRPERQRKGHAAPEKPDPHAAPPRGPHAQRESRQQQRDDTGQPQSDEPAQKGKRQQPSGRKPGSKKDRGNTEAEAEAPR